MAYRDYGDDLYHRDPFSRKRDLGHEVFHDEFSARERAFRDMDMRLPPLGPEDPYYHRREGMDSRDPLARGMHFPDPMFEPPLTSPPLDRLRPGDHFDDPLPPRPGLDSMRIGSVVVFPPKTPKFPKKASEAPCRTLYVGNLPRNTTKSQVEDLFSRYGQIENMRLSHNYAHIHFFEKTNLLKAIDLDGARIQVGPTNSPDDCGSIVVEFSIRHQEAEAEKQEGGSAGKDSDLITYTATNASTLPAALYKEAKFRVAAKSLKAWFEQGHCTSSTAYSFYNLLTSTNTCTRRAKKQLKEKEEELERFLKRQKETLTNMAKDCQYVIDIFQVACHQKSRDNFTKGQRKMVMQWADAAKEFSEELIAASNNPLLSGTLSGPPPTKTRVIDSGGSAEVQALKREVDQLKAEKAVAIQGRDNQIQNLKGFLAKFKEECPTEWEKITEGKDVLQEEQQDSDSENGLEIIEEVGGAVSAAAPTTTEAPPTETPPTDTPAVEVPVGDVPSVDNEMDIEEDKDEGEMEGTSLAAAAAAYAQIRSTIGSVGQEGLGLTEPEVAIVTVLASFLAVHPLGATINEITLYFQGFNPSYNSHYLESLLRRLSKVFQLSANAEGLPGKWWFLGFQTCCSMVGETRQPDEDPTGGATEPAAEVTIEETSGEDS